MGLLNEIWDVITKDVKNENETKKTAVIVRLYSLIMCLYFLVQSMFLGAQGYTLIAPIGVIFMLGYVIAFYTTYLDKTQKVVGYTQLLTLSWIILYVYLVGWDLGVQHFLFVLVIFSVLTTYHGTGVKIRHAVIYCGIRLALYAYCKWQSPKIEIVGYTSIVSQIINTVTIFIGLVIVVIIFSQESMSMEKKLVDYNAKIKKLASTDPLTKLLNRRAALEHIDELIAKVKSNNEMFVLAIGDIDFFKTFNDTYGHEAGDAVLVAIANQLKEKLDGKGRVARWGGEEFLLIYENANGDNTFLDIEDLRASIAKMKIPYNDKILSVTMTFGMEEYDPRRDIDYTINNADKKLYMGKSTGRNKVIF